MIRLSPEQEAVVASQDNSAVVACPGSGKTTTMVEKAAKWLRDGVDPKSIAVITFTRKAAAEIRRRLRRTVGTASDQVYVGTFHSLLFQVIASNWRMFGYTSPRLLVLDREDSKRMLRTALEAASEKRSTFAMKELQDYGSGQTPITSTVRVYRELLQRENVCDYSLLARMVLDGLEGDDPDCRKREVIEWLEGRCEHLIVDEFQDSDTAQYAFYRTFAARFCYVADPQQTIYSWRGADERLMARIQEDRSAVQLHLSVNRRSAKEIVRVANEFRCTLPSIVSQPPMEAIEGAPEGTVRILDEHGIDVENKISTADGSVAVIARTNYLVTEWSRRLTNAGIRHHVVGRDDKILEQDDVKLAIAYLAWPELPDVGILAERVLSAEGASTLLKAKFRAEARERDVELYTHLMAVDNGFGLRPLQEFYDGFMEQDLGQRVSEACVRARQKRGGVDPVAFDALRLMLAQFLSITPAEYQTGANFVNWLASRDPHDDIREGGVQIMTAHSAKGLEFDTVVLVGLGDNEFPYRGDGSDNPSEERRLFYVAMTRAKKVLYLVRPSGKVPSRYLEEIASCLTR
jgi:DNA helicase-2/ATP-dependent DNA helicase PcrA